MDLFYALLFGTIQGLTEFLPVSSTGHLIILEKIFHLSSDKFGLSFDIALHLGTLLALLIYFRQTIMKILTDFIKGETKIMILLVIGTIPAVIIGVILETAVNTFFRSPALVAFNLIFFSFIFLLLERVGKKEKEIKSLKILDSLIIGTFQAVALLPGVSRSGITISGGLFRDLKEKTAGEFAFLLSIPIVFIASLKGIYDLVKLGINPSIYDTFVLGIISSFIVGFICIKFFLDYLKKHGFMPFIIYRILLAFILIFFLRF